VKLRFNDAENKILDDVVDQIGEQRATLLRQMVMREARLILAEDDRRDALLREGSEGVLKCAS